MIKGEEIVYKDYKHDNRKKNNSYISRVIIIVLLIIILLLLFFCRFGKLTYEYGVPTGNVDVFDIDIFSNYFWEKAEEEAVETDGKTIKMEGSNGTKQPIPYENGTNNSFIRSAFTDKYGNPINQYNKEKDKNVLGTVFIDDINGNYIYQEKLNIFTNPAFEYTNKIAPGSTNVYNFVVHNSCNSKIKYTLEMYEESEYDINMKYRLKNENTYVIGSENAWVTSNELKTKFKELNMGFSDKYSLDWKWEYSENKNHDIKDTNAGENMENEYKLNIRFYFEAIGD